MKFKLGTVVGIKGLDVVDKIKGVKEFVDIDYLELENFGGLWKEKDIEIVDFGVFEFTPGIYEVVKDGEIVAWSSSSTILQKPGEFLLRCVAWFGLPSYTCYTETGFTLNKGSYASWQESQKYFSPDEVDKFLAYLQDAHSVLNRPKSLNKFQYTLLTNALSRVRNAIERVKPTGE